MADIPCGYKGVTSNRFVTYSSDGSVMICSVKYPTAESPIFL